MNHHALTRREWLGTASAGAGSVLLGGLRSFAATEPEQPLPLSGENEHFVWRILSKNEPYIDTQRDNKAFAFQGTKIMLSEDCGKTWPHTAEFAEAQNITLSVILKNGNIVFATRERLFLSTDNLKTHREIIVKRPDGTDYLPHKPVKPDQPGWYFHALDGEHCFEVDGKEMLVWGNYCNVLGGAVPVNIYYSTDNGETVKLAYAFGVNPSMPMPHSKLVRTSFASSLKRLSEEILPS